jgi:hypothetical protein
MALNIAKFLAMAIPGRGVNLVSPGYNNVVPARLGALGGVNLF